MKSLLAIEAVDNESQTKAENFSNNVGFPLCIEKDSSDFLLEFSKAGVRLLDLRSGKPVEIKVDFTAGASVHRMKYGGGKSQAIAKAVGVSPQFRPTVLDATAGLGMDAFVLASLGCKVTMLERAPVAFALLEDGLQRARHFVEITISDDYAQLAETIGRLELIKQDSLQYMRTASKEIINVVYLDPMFPERKKTAQVKKEMIAFQELVGKDEDSDALLEAALGLAENRVVVKRPGHAPFLANSAPSYQLKGKSSRFDIYTKKKLG